METRDYFIEALKHLLEAGDKTQKEVAEHINSTPPYLNRFIRKKANLSESKRLLISEYLGISYLDMLLLGKLLLSNVDIQKVELDQNFKILDHLIDHLKEPTSDNRDKPTGQKIHDLTTKHKSLVERFKYKDKGLAANESLLTIEEFDRSIFFETVTDLELMAIEAKEGRIKRRIKKASSDGT